MNRIARERARVGVLAPLLLATLCACSGQQADTAFVSPTIPVLEPGRPGEPNSTRTGAEVTPPPQDPEDPDDIGFMQDMIVHHAQAIVMVDVAEPQLTDDQVRALASRIRDEQEPEIGSMAGWLGTRDLDVPPQATNPRLADHGSHHSSMPGMATDAQLQQLSAARGAAADRLWLTLMIAHHEGALQMVEDQRRGGVDDQVSLLADEIAVTQGVQIGHMREMLDRLT